MQVYKCDRCGKEMPRREAEISLALITYPEATIRGLISGFSDHASYDRITNDLCENCYQTIKEVLEDGEIK